MITLTPIAVEEIKRLFEKDARSNPALRVGVKGGGCSGMSYTMGLDEVNAGEHDQMFEYAGITVLIDTKSAQYLDGMTIDYKQNNLLGGGFEFLNPNAKKSCGCGTSFTI